MPLIKGEEWAEEPAQKIWWLASYPKSGNTWARMFLSAYRTGGLDINNAYGCLADNQVYFHQVCSPKPLRELKAYETLAVRQAALLHQVLVTHAADPYVLKTHNANAVMEGLPLIPWALTAGAVYIVRDPRDVVLSYADHFGAGIDGAIEALAQPKNTIMQPDGLYHVVASWSLHVESWLESKSFPTGVIKYEDLHREPEPRFRRLLGYFGIDPIDEGRFENALALTRFDALRAQEDARGFREKSEHSKRFFRRGQAGGWRDVLSASQVARIEQDHGEMMERLGYERHGRRAAAGSGRAARGVEDRAGR